MLKITQGTLQYPRTQDSELSAARSGNLTWGIVTSTLARRCTVEHLPPYLRRNEFVFPVFLYTTRISITAKIDVAILLHKGYLKRVEGMDSGMQRRVGVPGRQEAVAVRVHECHCGREGGVVVDGISQVGHDFAALVQRGGECDVGGRRGGRVDGVDCALPAK